MKKFYAILIILLCMITTYKPLTLYAAVTDAAVNETDATMNDTTDVTYAHVDCLSTADITQADEALNEFLLSYNEYVEEHSKKTNETINNLTRTVTVLCTIICVVLVLGVVTPILCLVSISLNLRKISKSVAKLADVNCTLLK